MATLVIDGVFPAWDGRYDFPDFSFTNGELYRIKQMSGIRAGELIEALEANDTAAYVGVAAVILGRHGVQFEEQYLWNANVGSIVIDVSEPDADPPTIVNVPDEPPSSSGIASAAGGE